MAIDWHALFDDLGVQHWTAGKNVAKDHVNTQCPFCTDTSNHLSFSIIYGNCRCWKCGAHPAAQAISIVAGVPIETARRAIKKYSNGVAAAAPEIKYASTLTVPGSDLLPMHRNYLIKRRFDPDRLVKLYGIKGTGLNVKWEGSDFSLRIIIPVRDIDGNVVSFQGRDITNVSDTRYKACPKEKALLNYKDILYGADLAANRDDVVVVEGVFDAWRLGPGAVATFGTGCTTQQILALARWKRVTFFFDPESDAQRHAVEYARTLSMYGTYVDVAWEDFGPDGQGGRRDVGDLYPHEVARIKSELGL